MRRQLGRPLYNTCGVPRVIAVITVLLFGRPPCFCSTVLLCGQRVQAARAAGTKGVAHRRATRGWRFEPCRPVRCVCFRVSPVHGLLLRSQLPRAAIVTTRKTHSTCLSAFRSLSRSLSLMPVRARVFRTYAPTRAFRYTHPGVRKRTHRRVFASMRKRGVGCEYAPTRVYAPDAAYSQGTRRRSSHHISSRERPSHHISSSVRPSHHISSRERPSHHISSRERPSHHISSSVRPSHHISSRERPSHHISSSMRPSHHISSSVRPSHHISSSVRHYHVLCQGSCGRRR